MKNLTSLFCVIQLAVLFTGMMTGCAIEQGNSLTKDDEVYETPDGLNEDVIPSPVSMRPLSISRWTETTHNNFTDVCAWQWGVSPGRRNTIQAASEMPDTYQSGIENGFNQQWSHAYIYHSLGFWVWGDADDDFHDNLDGDSGESESPEGYNGKWAGYYYNRDDQYNGDWYLGYACHYIEDVSLVLHNTIPDVNMAVYHFAFEEWVENNLTSGHKFLDDIKNDWNYYPVTDPKEGIRSAAWNTNWGNSNGIGKKVWQNYEASGFPTGTETGNSTLVAYTRIMVREAGRFTKGAIKYALDRYNQWTDEY
jgi:hypothetical protein